LAHGLADEACRVALSRFRGPLIERTKTDGSLVTDADEAVEDCLRAVLAVERPSDAVLGEERGQTGTASRRWIIDGIDGTISFAAGGRDWGTLIALEIEGRVVLGICEQPTASRRYFAARQRGAYVHSRSSGVIEPVKVTQTTELAVARSFIAPPEWLQDDSARHLAGRLGRATRPCPAHDHPALQVATGGYEIALFVCVGGGRLQPGVAVCGPWDLAAPSIVVEEAGGRFSDLSGGRSLHTGSGIFSNGVTHDAALAALAAKELPEQHVHKE
jgi:histidinol-phosphatase